MSKAALIDAVRQLDLEESKRLLQSKPSLMTVTDRQGRSLLHMACFVPPFKRKVSERAQVRFVEFLLERGLEIDLPIGKDAVTPLFCAVAGARNTALIKFLIDRGAKVTAAPGGGLFAAGWWGDVASMKLLLANGAPIDVVVGITPFLASWCWKKFEAAKCLALNGANVNFRDRKGWTALRHGIEKEYDPKLLTWLVKHGAELDLADREGVTPRLKASRKRDRRFINALTRGET